MEFWVLLLACALNLALALIILTRATRASSTAFFGISALFISLWALGTMLMLYGWTDATIRVGMVLFLVAPMLTTLYMVVFAKHFSGVDFPKKYTTSIIFSAFTAVFAAVVLSMVPTTTVIEYSANQSVVGLDFQHGWYALYGVYFMLMFTVSYGYLVRGIMVSKGKTHTQRVLVLVGLFLASFLALITNVLLPLLGNNDLLWLGPAWTIFYIVSTIYAMVRHGLFDLRLALVLTFTYFLSLGALAVLYYAIALAISSVFFAGDVTVGFSGLDVAIAIFLAFLFQPIRRFFDTFTSNIFYQNSYKVDDFFAKLSGILTSTNDLQLLLKRAATEIGQTLKATDASFVIYTGENRTEQEGSNHYKRIPYKDIEWLDTHILSDSSEPKVLGLLDDSEDQLRRLMVSHSTAIVLPLVRQGVKMGYLFLGEHKRSSYTARDIRVVRALADELVIAIQNALSIKEVKELNAHLEQRIDTATKELRASNAQLQRLDEAKDEFMSMASHQLRTPLTSIKGYISMLIEGDMGPLSKEQKQVLGEAFMSSERMVRLISDFLNVSRLQTGKFVIEKRPTDLATLVQHEVSSLKSNAATRNQRFVYKAPKNLPLIELDENKIQQVVMNFSDNALYYSKDGGVITVSLKKTRDGYVECTVKDQGIGVPEEERAQLFNKFFRATNARRARPDGTGVGLFLAKKVIDAHNGSIIFESIEGKGSTFGFRLPLTQPTNQK